MPAVSYSEVKKFRHCMKAHHYRYTERLARKKKGAPLLRGSILHEMLDSYVQHKILAGYTGPDPWAVLEKYEEEYGSLLIEEQEHYGNLIEDCSTIFENYLRYYRKDPLKYEASEEFVATDLAQDLRYIGYIDKVAVDKEGRRWLVDHKFVRTIPSMEDQFHEIQLLIYVWAYRRWNPSKPIDGIMYDYCRTKTPTVPEVLKSGKGLTKRANIDTDYYTYNKAIADNGFDQSEYVDILETLKDKSSTFFQRVKQPAPSNQIIESIVEDFRTTALMIQKLKGIAPRSMSNFNCKNCEYRPLCEAEVRGHDTKFILKTEFRKREETHSGDTEKVSED
jgi:RecB family exonuclease